jgi:glutaredoxin 3
MNQTARVRVYTTKICPYCFRAKALLAKRGVAFEEIDVSDDPEKRTWLVQATGQKTVPQIFIGEKAVGGSDELAALDRTGELVERVFGPTASQA